jgi:hypothetical protein
MKYYSIIYSDTKGRGFESRITHWTASKSPEDFSAGCFWFLWQKRVDAI